jgi:transposase, IS4 family
MKPRRRAKGNPLKVVVHAAKIHNTKSGIRPAKQALEEYPTIRGFCTDVGYRTTFVQEVQDKLGLKVDFPEKITLQKSPRLRRGAPPRYHAVTREGCYCSSNASPLPAFFAGSFWVYDSIGL